MRCLTTPSRSCVRQGLALTVAVAIGAALAWSPVGNVTSDAMAEGLQVGGVRSGVTLKQPLRHNTPLRRETGMIEEVDATGVQQAPGARLYQFSEQHKAELHAATRLRINAMLDKRDQRRAAVERPARPNRFDRNRTPTVTYEMQAAPAVTTNGPAPAYTNRYHPRPQFGGPATSQPRGTSAPGAQRPAQDTSHSSKPNRGHHNKPNNHAAEHKHTEKPSRPNKPSRPAPAQGRPNGTPPVVIALPNSATPAPVEAAAPQFVEEAAAPVPVDTP